MGTTVLARVGIAISIGGVLLALIAAPVSGHGELFPLGLLIGAVGYCIVWLSDRITSRRAPTRPSA